MKSKFVLIAVLIAAFVTAKAGDTPRSASWKMPAGVTQADLVPGTLVIRLKEEYRSSAQNRSIALAPLNETLTRIGATTVEKIFPNHTQPATERNTRGEKLVDLSLIYQVTYNTNVPVEKAVNALLSTGLLEYAEPRYVHRLLFTPNDPNTGQQYHLTRIQAYAGWDISQGDTNVVIGIVDTGSDLDHPDLEPNLKYNYNDPINGIDDDNDGYTDNWRGWDLGENDNNATVNVNNHGSHVTGCAAGATNNGIGAAAPGFNCKFMAVKISNASGSLTKGYEGIAYAADMGCQIINLSWGGAGGGSFGQNIIDYATFNKNSLVVAAAGNDGNETVFFPASYNNVLSVASTTNTDAKSSFSNFGAFVDVCSPGSNIYAAMSNNTYNVMSGTSMASPVAAGAAAVVKAHYPSYSALQVGEQLRVTCDNIYGIGNNGTTYNNKLGKGRINMYRALTETSPSVRMKNMLITDNNDNTFVAGDTLRISGDIINYLAATTNLDLTLTSTSTWVNIIDNQTYVGALGTMATVDNHADPFLVVVNAGAPLNTKVTFKINFVDGSYVDFQIFDLVVNVDYINVTINQVATTITSKGRLCYNGTGQAQGLGFVYNGENLVYEAGVMIGQSSSKVSDNVRGDGTNTDNDFQSVQVVQRLIPSIQSEFDLFGKFNDNLAQPTIPVLVSHRALAWSTPGDDKYVIVEYTIKNSGSSTFSNLWAGIFADWDIQDYSLNKANENAALKMGYVYNTTATGLWAGIKLLTQGPFNHYAVDNIAGGGGANLSDGYSTAEKYTTLSTARATAGGTGTGNDVIDVVSTGPFTLSAGDSVTVAFALIAGDDVDDLNTSAANAQIKYDNTTSVTTTPGNTNTVSIYPNPVKNTLLVSGITDDVKSIEITDLTGKVIRTISNELNQPTDVSRLASGVYFVTLLSDKGNQTIRFIKE